jgi:hypothetical protein
MNHIPEAPDIQTHCRSLSLQGIDMLSRLAEIAMQLAEGEGARALAAQAWAAEVRADPARLPGDDADPRIEARDAGLAFDRFARSVQRSLSLRGRAADGLCARDTAARKARRARQRNRVQAVMEGLIWAPGQSERELDEADHLTGLLHEQIAWLYNDEDDRVEDRPVGSVIAGLACGLGLSDQWRRRAADWSDPPHPPRPTGTPDEIRARRKARLIELMDRSIAAIADAKRRPAVQAGLKTRLQEPDVEAMLDQVPPGEAAIRLSRSLALDFTGGFDDEDPDSPDTG